MNTVTLAGCRVEPLGSYLKALAVLRLVSEQADSNARGCWERGCFHLETSLDESGLVQFFLERYAPTPILSPWNEGSGFYPKAHKQGKKTGIDLVTASSEDRFSVYRDAILKAKQIPSVGRTKPNGRNDVAQEKVPKAEEDRRRTAIQLACRNLLPDSCVEWLDAVVGISADGDRTFPPILGTGGNDGNLDYTSTFMEHLARMLVAPDGKAPVASLLQNALFEIATGGFQAGSTGQYDPGLAGGFNQGAEVETEKSPSNPWNFILTLEGTVAWAAGIYRRQGVSCKSFLCSPFTVNATRVGYVSASANDGARAEVWTPLWERPARYTEVKALLREGRVALDGRPARNGLEFAQAACMLGVDRGISGFMRYSLLMRRGKSYIALPAGRFAVGERRESDLVRELGAVLEGAHLKDAPAEYDSLRRQVDETIYEVLLRGGGPAVQDLAACVGKLHRWILTTGKPMRLRQSLSPEWVAQLQDVPEARIAAAMAGIWHREAGPLRDHLDRNEKGFAWTGASLAERMARVLERRVMLGDALGMRQNPLGSAYRASTRDAILFLEGSLDDGLIEDLLFAFTLVDWRKAAPAGAPAANELGVWPLYALLKNLYMAQALDAPEGGVYVRGDLGVLAALKAGDEGQAARIGVRRLRNAGLLPVDADYLGGFDPMRLAGSLLIPVPYDAALRRICRSGESK